MSYSKAIYVSGISSLLLALTVNDQFQAHQDGSNDTPYSQQHVGFLKVECPLSWYGLNLIKVYPREPDLNDTHLHIGSAGMSFDLS